MIKEYALLSLLVLGSLPLNAMQDKSDNGTIGERPAKQRQLPEPYRQLFPPKPSPASSSDKKSEQSSQNNSSPVILNNRLGSDGD